VPKLKEKGKGKGKDKRIIENSEFMTV